MGTTRAPCDLPTPSGTSSSSLATSSSASPSAVGMSVSSMPGSPWMPRPTAIRPSGTENSGCSAPGSVQPVNATPNERVRSLARRRRRVDLVEVVAGLGGRGGDPEHREVAGDAAALVPLGERGAEMSSVTVTVSQAMPSARSRSCAASKLSTSPA